MSSIIINNLSTNGATAANDIGAASGADTPAKLVTLVDSTNRKIPTDAGTAQAENIVASGLDAIADGDVYARTTISGAIDANAIAATPGASLAARLQAAANVANGADVTADNAPKAHAASHKHGGSDEIATATPGANVIPKAGVDSKLAAGFIPQATNSAVGGALLGASGGAAKLTAMPDGATAVYSQDTWATADGCTATNGVISFPSPGTIRITWNGVGTYFGLSRVISLSAGHKILSKLSTNSNIGTIGFFHIAPSGNSWLDLGPCSSTPQIKLGQFPAIAGTNISIFKSGSLVSGDYIDVDWLWIGDYSMLDGSMLLESARVANELAVTQGVGVAASGTITATDQPTATKGDTIGGKKYTYVAALTASPGVEGEVLIGSDKEDTLENLNLAISEVSRTNNGVKYWAAAVHPLVSTTRSGAVLNLSAKNPGLSGNQITVTCESGTNHTASGSTLSGGKDAVGEKIRTQVENYIAGSGTRPAAAKIERTNTALIGFELTTKVANGATYTFPAGGTFDWVVLAYDANIGGADQGTAAGGSTVTMAGANSKLWIRRRS